MLRFLYLALIFITSCSTNKVVSNHGISFIDIKSKQLVENMFSNEEGANYGTFTLEGNTITYERKEICDADGLCDDWIVMTIVGADGSTTTIEIPIGTGGF